MQVREDFIRARSDREKEARKIEILEAADSLLSDQGNERFAVAAVAEKVGVSKSTVFLYFANKDELLLALYARAGARFSVRLKGRLRRGMTGREFCEAFADVALEDPTYLILRAFLANSIERAVSQQSLIAAKTEIVHNQRVTAEYTGEFLGVVPARCAVMLQALMNLLAGATQVDVTPYIDADSMPEDVAGLIRSGNRRSAFMAGAEFIFTGATGLPYH